MQKFQHHPYIKYGVGFRKLKPVAVAIHQVLNHWGYHLEQLDKGAK